MHAQMIKTKSPTIFLRDINGRLIIQKSISLSESTIDVSALPKGNYFITINSEKGEYTKKITKQ